MKLVKNIITIDGPSGVGKGTLAFSLAERLGWNVLDSGLLYRLVAFLSFKYGLEITQEIPSENLSIGVNINKKVEIKTGMRTSGNVEIISGLQENDKIVAEG